MTEKIVTIKDGTENEELSYRYEITSYGADYPVDSVVKRIDDEVIYVPTFQRKFVWNIAQASKFIESLILGLPVPGIFLSREPKTGKLLIVDGQQRLMSLYNFYHGVFKGKEFKLTGIQSDLNGRTLKTLAPSDKIRLDDSIIHATIVRQDEPDDEESSIYMIFERLNTGGKPLTAQEIRACIYYGEFNELLNGLTEGNDWRLVFGKENERLKEQELILRFFTLFYERDSYVKPLKGFMNAFMSRNRNFELYSPKELTELFENNIKLIARVLGNKAFRIGKPINAAVFEGVMIGLAVRLRNENISDEEFQMKYIKLIENPDFIATVKGGTSDEKIIQDRLRISIDAFN
ncbi:MAG: DUF262 domain-containing protein [Salinivirgaceae bacterium]